MQIVPATPLYTTNIGLFLSPHPVPLSLHLERPAEYLTLLSNKTLAPSAACWDRREEEDEEEEEEETGGGEGTELYLDRQNKTSVRNG